MADFYRIEKKFHEIKSANGADIYVACFGKTFLRQNSQEYKLSTEVGYKTILNRMGVIHGGYSGAMEAVSRGANKAISEQDYANKYWNIGVPMKAFDKELKRSSDVNLPSSDDIGVRKRALVELCDICVVLPSGGVGTLLEVLEIFHMNQIAEKFGGRVRPIIFLGGNWKKIMTYLFKNLDMNKQSVGEDFLYFCKNINEYSEVLALINKKPVL